jgi:hypothetical protein
MGYYIRHYPRVAAISGNPHFSIVLSRLLYHEDLRLKRHAAFFILSDLQLATECGLGAYQCATARDLICAPGVELFSRERRGMPALNHYHGNLERIYTWLTTEGRAGTEGDSFRVGKNLNQESDFSRIKSREKPAPFKNLFKEKSDDDDDARARARVDAAEKVLKDWGIENPSRQCILERLKQREDIVEVIRSICESTSDQWALGVNTRQHAIKRPVGLIISRLLHEVDEQGP